MTETATLAGGCFWCTEAVFDALKGVTHVELGYIGGHVTAPTYEQVCSGRTGHAEAVRITFDPAQVTYADLLDIFFHTHDPTTLNRQGADTGTQYRSAIFPHSPEQRAEAEAAIARNQADWDNPDRHQHRGRRAVVQGGSLPPALLREEPQRRLLRRGRRAEGREVPQGLCRAAEGGVTSASRRRRGGGDDESGRGGGA